MVISTTAPDRVVSTNRRSMVSSLSLDELRLDTGDRRQRHPSPYRPVTPRCRSIRGMTTSRSGVQQRKASLPIRRLGPDIDQGTTAREGGAPNGSDVRAHKVNLNEPFAVLARFWADEMEVRRKTKAFDATSTEPIRKGP